MQPNSRRTTILIKIKLLVLFIFVPTLSWGLNITEKTTTPHPVNPKTEHNYQIVSDIVRLGTSSQRFELNHGECGQDQHWDDCNNDRQRVEREILWKGLNKTKWFGFSIYLNEDYPTLDNTSWVQSKIHDWRHPIWMLQAKGISVNLTFNSLGGDRGCYIGKLSSFRGKWNDIVIKTEYSFGEGKKKIGESYIEFYLNGNKIKKCSMRYPVLTENAYNESGNKDFFFKYGIYNSYVSNWLDKNKTKEVNSKEWKDTHEDSSGSVISSKAKSPFEIDWGVIIPKQIIYLDEMRIGNSKEDVNINLINKAVD